jgi:serine/threonine-protein kinase
MSTRSNATIRDTGITHADTLETPGSNAVHFCASARRERSRSAPPPRVVAGKYRLDELLGEGGMGAIWKAFHLQLELPVAIKLLRPGFQNAELAERLRGEARVAAGLMHPNIVRVFDVGESEAGEPFIVMELLRGESLAQLLARGPLSPINVVRLLLPIAEALAAAHARGVVHRDVKPDNVFVTSAGRVALPKLLDFGIAKVQTPAGGGRRNLTLSGTLLGSPDYMSPEQVAGHPDLDQRSDTWSFCVMLHEALSGQPPFSAPTLRALRRSICEQTPPSLEAAGVEPALARIVRQGLEKDPERRPASMAALGRALASWLVEQGVESDAAGSSLSAKWLEPPSEAGDPASSSRIEAAGERQEPVTLVSETLHELHLPRRYRWSLAGAVAVAAAALGGLVVSVAARQWSPLDSGAATTTGAEPSALVADSERGCPAAVAIPALAAASPERSVDFAYSTARLEDAAQGRATTAKAAQLTSPNGGSELPARGQLPF